MSKAKKRKYRYILPIHVRTDSFCDELARIAAKRLARVHPDHRPLMHAILQEATSLFSPYIGDRIDREVAKYDKARARR